MFTRALAVAGVALVIALGAAPEARALDEAHARQGREMLNRSIQWLLTQQDKDTGGWGVNPDPKSPQHPAITALVLTALLDHPQFDHRHPAVERAIRFILKYQQPDGGIYDRILPSYNTSICLSALARVRTPEAIAAIKPAQDFLRSLQWSEDAIPKDGETGKVDTSHPFYGGLGYGRHGRPDLSNLNLMLQGLHDSGLSSSDPAFQRALVFLARTQMLDEVNDQPYADGSRQGGFIYATAENKDTVGKGQSHASQPTVEETLSDGTVASRLRAYGSMTYAGFKSMIYADLKRDDPRITAARDWIRSHYTLDENPGVGTDGLYYYFLTFARAMDAWGVSTIDTLDADGKPGPRRDWANDLIARLAKLQSGDGSFTPVDDRWMENNPVLITAYAALALQRALD